MHSFLLLILEKTKGMLLYYGSDCPLMVIRPALPTLSVLKRTHPMSTLLCWLNLITHSTSVCLICKSKRKEFQSVTRIT